MKKVRFEYTYINEDFENETLSLREDEALKLYRSLNNDFHEPEADW